MKITTEPQKKPNPSQTTVKTVYDPTKEKGPLQGSKSIRDKTTYRERENFESQKIKLRKTPNGKGGKSFPEGEGPVRQVRPGGDGEPDGNGGPDKGRKPPRKGEGPSNGFRKVNGGGGESDPSDDDGDGGGSTPPSSELHQQEESIEGPSLSMYCRDHQVKWDSQVRQVGMEEMAKHPN